MPFAQPAKSPNMDKLFQYLQKSQWHNVSANFSGFVRKEFEANVEKLEEDEETYRNLKLMIEYSEMGRFSEAKNLLDPAYREFNEMLNKLTEINLLKHSPRRAGDKPPQNPGHYTQRRDVFTPDKRETGNYTQRREIFTPDKRNPGNTQKREAYTPDRRDGVQMQNRPQGYTPDKKETPVPGQGQRPPSNPGYDTQRHHEVSERSPRTPQYPADRPVYDPHRDNYDSLRLKSPEKQPDSYQQGPGGKYESPRLLSPADHSKNSLQDRHSPAHTGIYNTAGQLTSSKALWGRDHGDKPSEKIAGSTYRHDFPTYAVENHERKDKEIYRTNFGSMAERDIYRSGDDSYDRDDRKRSGTIRHVDTPDYDHRPSELARKFKELYNNEWTDAYDEVCKDFGSEKTVRHLLWIVTEAWLIGSDIADKQLGDLEKAALGLMTSPGPVHSMDHVITHTGGYAPRNLGDTLPTSRSLLIKYRKQTALLSIPYVKEECRDKISRTLIESSGFPKFYLGDGARLTAYIYKCAELTWLMCVQDPPIVLEYINKETEGARFNHEHYNVYTKSGTTYDFGVWPLLRIGKKGQILAKGIAQGI